MASVEHSSWRQRMSLSAGASTVVASNACQPAALPQKVSQMNDSVYELCKPEGGEKADVQVIFFHGLKLGNYRDAYLTTWMTNGSGDEDGNGHGNVCWPQSWLRTDFPRAHVFSVSYDSSARKTSSTGRLDMAMIGQCLLGDIVHLAQTGQKHPVVLVGYSLGGLVIKQLCLQAELELQQTNSKAIEMFLRNIRGIYYYSTPHGGSGVTGLADYLSTVNVFEPSAVFPFLRVFSTERARINEQFRMHQQKRKWRTAGVCENYETRLGPFRSVVVPEESGRPGVDDFLVVAADHFTICKPESRKSVNYLHLVKFIQDILQEEEDLAQELHQNLPDHVVGIETRVRDVLTLLDKFQSVAIVGMGGIGKTTLVRTLFNRISHNFEFTSFTADAREVAKKPGGVDKLRKRMMKNLYHFHYKEFLNHKGGGWNFLRNKKILLVLDDVDSEDQLKVLPRAGLFREGSRIIITSRSRQVVKDLDAVYEVTELSPEHSELLFLHHAFAKKVVPSSLRGIAEEVVEKCGRLPLALEVVGGFLRNEESLKVWKETLRKLEKAESLDGSKDDRLWAKLRVSVDALATIEREMFLDVASYFSGKKLHVIKAAWSMTLKSGDLEWRNLLRRCLVRVDEETGTVWMHQQLRDLGSSISSPSDQSLQQRERVFCHDDAEELLTRAQGDLNTKGLLVTSWKKSKGKVDSSFSSRMKNLQFLMLNGVEIDRPFKEFANSVALIQWHDAHFVKFPIRPRQLPQLTSLAVLDLAGCSHLQHLPKGFENLVNLQVLVLSQCDNLQSLPSNFGKLQSLKRLELCDTKLSSLPDSIGHLSALEHLDLTGSSKLLAVPSSLSKLSALAVLKLRHNRGFERLDKHHGLQILPESLGDLSALERLELEFDLKENVDPSFAARISDCLRKFTREASRGFREKLPGKAVLTARSSFENENLGFLAKSFSHLSGLRRLQLVCHGILHSLPETLGDLSSLERLELVVDALEHLPESLGKLSSLQLLQLHNFADDDMKISREFSPPRHFPNFNILGRQPLSSLRHSSKNILQVSINACTALPASFGRLTSLVYATFEETDLQTLPDCFANLKHLKFLRLHKWKKLQKLPEAFGCLTALVYLEFSNCTVLRSLPEAFGQLSFLSNLILHSCHDLENLPDSFGQLRSLRNLSIHDCNKLRTLTESFGNLKSLREFRLTDCGNFQDLPESFGNLMGLSSLLIGDCSDLQGLPESFGRLASIQELTFYNCVYLLYLPDSFGWMSNLQRLEFEKCTNLQTLPEGFGQLSSLRELKFVDCFHLRNLPPSFCQLSSIRHLELVCCKTLQFLPESLGELSSLEILVLACKSVVSIPESIEKLHNLSELFIIDLNIQRLPEVIVHLPALSYLCIWHCELLESLPEHLNLLQALRVLDLENLPSISKFPNCLGPVPEPLYDKLAFDVGEGKFSRKIN